MSDLYQRLRAFEGRPAAVSGQGSEPVNLSMIRHWCEVLGDTDPAYTGKDPVAPATMLQAWTMGGIEGPQSRSPAIDELFALLDGAGYTAVVATDCEQEYVRALRPGETITFDSVIESVSPRKTTRLGAGHFVTTRMEIRADHEPAGTHRFRILKYAPRKAVKERGERPRPVINRDNAGFWEGVAAHKLLFQRCDACGTSRFPWLPGCGGCGSPEWTAVEASGAGTVHSYVVMHHPPFPAFDPPYAVALVELAEGVRMISNITGVAADRVRIGMPVTLEFLRVAPDQELPVFRAVASEGGPPPTETDPRAEPPTGGGDRTELPPLTVPITRTLIIAGAIASRDFKDVHHDPEAARAAGSPDIFMNILTTNGLVGRYITDHLGPGAELRKVAIRLGAPNRPGDELVLTGTVTSLRGRTAEVAVVGANGLGRHVTGSVTVTLPEATA
ncbi:putative OB-fold protein/acyl dehydratase [Streptomyces netropsis]|uniref:Putative OB-fold protein/acyl dehydratase n=1 Tax=Streptomyces netropsis TaxID=55404 RepID=A0A7W7LHZ3_STRNE|nr:OB-fold domain-containing protein [Streptomyces netropsis]MBB4890588.1 putative OB-fold protein/acyl dehydratase [Streptomyces netropsis]GGR50097.1 hypothetical protein GCM10010219_64270 [Streptomyces netropsis]